MPSFAPALETTLHKALEAASSRRHEYATLEHLLLALIDDEHASKVMTACNVDIGELKTTVAHYLDTELDARITVLQGEIARCQQKKERAVNHRASADGLFKR